MSADDKARKNNAAYSMGRDCGYKGFSSSQLGAQLLKMSKEERKYFDLGLVDGTLEKNREATKKKGAESAKRKG